MEHPNDSATACAVPPAQLRRVCDPEQISSDVAAGLPAPAGLIGQQRAADALAFGLAMSHPGFNVFVAGPPGTGKTSSVRARLEAAAKERPVPPDWCYVHNFRDPARPRALRLAAGEGRRLRDDLRQLLRAARREIPRAFESEEYIAQREAILGGLGKEREQAFAALAARAHQRGILLQATPAGIAIIPFIGSQRLSEEDIAQLRPEMRETIERNREAVGDEVRTFLKGVRAAERQAVARLEAQDRDVALHAVGGLVEDLVDDFQDQPEVRAYLEHVRDGILADIALFRSHPLPTDGPLAEAGPGGDLEHALHERAFHKYEVNVVVDNAETSGAPVVLEPSPTYPHLVGRIEREAIFGALMTDFTLISAGALHRANGGYLVLRVDDLLRAPMAWDALKRSLREHTVVIEDAVESLGLATTRGLRPDPIPLDVKVFLIGDPLHYYLLHALDPDFAELFKVRADFDVAMDRTPQNEAQYAAFVSACAAEHGRPMDRGAVARLIEESSRLVGDQRKLSARLGEVTDLTREADHWAAADGAAQITAQHIRAAVEQRLYRAGLLRERLQEMVARGMLLIRPEGSAIGEVHGLAVLQLGEVAFGRPSRITATVGLGREGVLDIEREVELGGRIHSKGVLILAGYLADTYARDVPLAITARLVFEQSYEQVEGDSASLAELLALLSRLAEAPLERGIAVTGSVNQRGEVQAVGGLNEKIEGFFEACQATTFTGRQGVIIPASSVEQLMLRDDVVEAAAAGRFRVYAVRTVDEALEILSGLPAGARGADGRFPPESVHGRVTARLRQFAETLRVFGAPREAGPDGAVERPSGAGGGASR